MVLVIDMISGEVVSAVQGSSDETLPTAFGEGWNSEAEHLGLISLPVGRLVWPRQASEAPADVLDWDPEDFVRAIERR